MYKYKFLLSSVLIAFLILLAGYFYFANGLSDKDGKAPSPIVVHAVPVKTRTVENFIEAIGTTRAFESVTITVNVTEYIKQLFFEDGDIVKKGDVLVELETSEEKAQMMEAQARLEEARVQFERFGKLSKRDFLSKSEHDAQKATLDSAAARVEQIKSMMADRTLKAPFDGLLGFRRVSKGTLVEPGDEIVTLDKIQPLKIDFSLPERYLANLHKGQGFTARSIAYKGKLFTGTISTINPRIDEQARAVLLRGLLNNEQLLLKPGMLLHIKLPLGHEKVLTVPEEALLAQGMERYIFIVDKNDNKARKINVKLLKRHERWLDIEAQVPTDSWIITDGAFKLREGQLVDVKYVDH
ncbi:efflux RND transporter periplasmic adaptor subunit [Legionella israelensis]|uniref:Efflux RND transporter periplasmic adaptor subunit n=1 Tax=Legionella israelensis TaxID=454 RepID=A0A0W0WNF5_9GAMM|nr:efflux RND transporter periplasmic adaptor subunit [Legionella israelensis]KTD33874.1 hemolysin D [Legionella israelensis]QBR83600.1 efflux RND transporter periplasmic adaptor subunit [Legionella israelensis]QBS08959.1 efflux RND transporter periplasmic adaptor subunit [Legionella israelensis]SCX81663.1 membrane fusion protein, multidrug efflux system [Legionella israelensis DSM 19235]STX58651.1 hemolysin D [Legionella israelensis]